uniref:Uncharacterized protein n=1 Tax=Arundo donax TaxID=35708 RepID=A0A0A9BUM8_ARUDO
MLELFDGKKACNYTAAYFLPTKAVVVTYTNKAQLIL